MQKDIHIYFTAAALILGVAGLAMTAAMLSGDPTAMSRLITLFSEAFTFGLTALIAYAVHSRKRID